jgi:lysylphosphatidylglycerol synthetase-like protein (DUF2156 family)
MKHDFLKYNFGFWRKLINAWSFLFFAMIIVDFIHTNEYVDILNAISTVYISLLAIYVSNKEFERWYDHHKESHPGEAFIVIWSALVGCLFIVEFAFKGYYKIPSSVVSSYIAVMTILVITQKSKELYKQKRGKRK